LAKESGWRVDPEGEVLEGDGWHIQTDIVERFAELVAAALAQPEREWQGLTDEEINDILDCGRPNLVDIKKAEQKLKEKNGY
jgi:hypothetical protein